MDCDFRNKDLASLPREIFSLEESPSEDSLSDIFAENSEKKTAGIENRGEKRKHTSESEEENSPDIFSHDSPRQAPKKVFKRLRKITIESDEDIEKPSDTLSKERKRKLEESPSSKIRQNQTKLLRKVPSEPDPGAVQELSLQKLSFSRIARHIKVSEKEIQSLTLEVIITKIIKIYNKNKEKRKKTNKRVLKPISFRSFANKEEFTLRVYTHTQKLKSRLTRELEKGSAAKLSKSKGINYFLFFFREKPVREIIVATSGNGWQVLRPCVHYDYPFNVVKRILNPERITEISRRCLVGSGISETLINPEGHELYKIANLYYLVETFKCEVKEDSSLMGLEFFNKDRPPIIKIATGLLRIQKNIPLRCYPPLLNLFSQYVRGEKTYTIGEDKQEEKADPLFEFLHFLRPVFTERKQLDGLLIKQIYESYRNKQKQTVFFRHKYLRDYLYASSYSVKLSSKGKFECLETRPSNVEAVLSLLNESAFKSAESLLKAFEEASFKFKKGSREIQSPLIECLEGEVRTSKGNTYFKMRGMWFKLAADCHALLQQDFKQLLGKVLIDPEKDEGQLPRAWQGNARKGKLTEKIIKNALKIKIGIKALMKVLKKEKVCFIDNGLVKERYLAGEILSCPLIKKYQKDIEEIVLYSDRVPAQDKLMEIFGEDTEEIIKELNKKRSIFDSKSYVVNPFLPSQLKKKQGLLKILKDYCEMARGNRESEEAYNRSYLYDQRNHGICYRSDTGYLVLDEICPYNVEFCDLVYYNRSKTFLYHVKEVFGQDTREACSQILNAAKELRSALSIHQGHCYLQELWRKATSGSTEGYLEKVKTQFEALGEEDFLNIFYKRKIIFVYAYLEKPGHSLLEEVKVPDRLDADHLVTVQSSLRKGAYKALVTQGYLDRQGRLTGKFYASSKERFTLEGFESERIPIYNSLMQYKSKSESTLAKFDLLHLAEEVQSLGFGFKICQIKQAETGKSSLQLTQESCCEEKEILPFASLHNIGNSCYMNAVLQMLFSIPEIQIKIKAQQDDFIIKKIDRVLEDPSRKNLKQLRNQIFSMEGIERKMQGGKKEQHDAHEFLRLLVEKLEWSPMQTFEEIEIAGSKSTSALTPEFHFSMGLSHSTFQDIVDNYFRKTEIVADGKKVLPLKRTNYGIIRFINRWHRTYCVKEWPAYLIIQLNRFVFDEEAGTTKRNNQSVEFPTNEVIHFPKENNYEIIGYINHEGKNAFAGHYTTDIKDDQGNWFNCDDSHIKKQAPVKPEKRAYLILLKKTLH